MKNIDRDESLLLRCDCKSFEFVEFGWFEDEPKIFYVTITAYPRTLGDKIKAMWRILMGSRYGITDEVLIDGKNAKRLVKWLQERVDGSEK